MKSSQMKPRAPIYLNINIVGIQMGFFFGRICVNGGGTGNQAHNGGGSEKPISQNFKVQTRKTRYNKHSELNLAVQKTFQCIFFPFLSKQA